MTRTRRVATCLAAVVTVLTCSPAVFAQTPASPAGAQATLSVGGDVPHPLSLTPADIKAMPRTTVTVTEEGREVKYEGVLVGEILKRAEAPVGRDLTGQAVATYVLAKAKAAIRSCSLCRSSTRPSRQTTSSSPTPSTGSRCSTIRDR